MKKILIMFIGVLLLNSCVAFNGGNRTVNSMFNQGGDWFENGDFASNGERIYSTASNDRDQLIPFTGGPNFGGTMMGMGTNLNCSSCHGADGQGGIHTMHMDVMDAPDIRYKALISEEEEHGNGEHGDEHGEYNLEAFRKAVIEGFHPDGEPLSRDMPRWRMDDKDLSDLLDYLKTLP